MRFLITPAVLFCACGGMSVDEFEVEVLADLCDAAAQCEQTFEADACYDFVRTVDRSRCDFDPKSASACEREIPIASCTDGGDLGTWAWQVPASCDAVWDCGPISLRTP
ncbi:MAG: hypothetical protein ACI8PZ_001539 [Myxococcota bacterium]|jgi:hypothetical protein